MREIPTDYFFYLASVRLAPIVALASTSFANPAFSYLAVVLISAPPIQKLLHTVDMICIDYYEARQRKNRANSWNDCHSRVEVSRQQAQKKSVWISCARVSSRQFGFRPDSI
jgi:hypothetical protein